MQLKLYRYLTWGSLLMAIILAGGAAYILFNHNTFLNFSKVFTIYVVVALVITLIYKFLENNIDKILLQKKVFKGEVVLANIKSYKYLTAFRDSGFRTYLLMQFEVTYYDANMQPHPATIIEKMNKDCTTIPLGSVYMTYDAKHPDNGMFVQNILISRVPELMPIVQKYESTKSINIKYLDVHYDTGLVIQTFKEALKQNEEKQKVSKQD